MKKLIIVMVVALLALALVACGGDAATTTKGGADTTAAKPADTTAAKPGDDTTAAKPGDDTTAAKPADTTTKAPETTKTPETTEPVPPMQAEINAIMDIAWWNQVHRMNPIARSKDVAGETIYTWSLTIKAESGLFTNFPAEHETYPNAYGISFTTGEGAVVYIKDMTQDTDYTKYNVKEGSWRTERWCDIYFEAEGFVPVGGAKYDMYLVFDLPTVEGASPYPGEKCYVWALEEPWTYTPPASIGDPVVDTVLADAFQCTVHRHSERCDVSWAAGDNAPADFDASAFPAMNFSFTVKAEDNLFPSGTDSDGNKTESFAEIIPEGAFAYVKGPNDTEFKRYECDYMLTERWCDMWFTLKDFTPEAGVQYEMVFCFMSGVSATNPYTLHYVYANNWVAGGGSPNA